MFTTAEQWESFIEKINDCMRGKATSFQLSYRWQGVDVTLTKESWKAFIHYLNSQCHEHTVLLDTKCSAASINDPILPQSSAKDELNKTFPTDDSLTDGNVLIRQLNKLSCSDENVKKITKERRIAAFRILCNSVLKEQTCSICPRRHLYNIIFS